MLACYQPDDKPLRSPPAFVATIGCIAKQIKIRGSSRDLRQVATPQAAPQSLPAVSPHQHDNTMVANRLCTMLEKSAKALDELHQKFTQNESLDKASSSKSLASGQSTSQDFSSLTPQALPAVPSLLPLPALEGSTAAAGEQIEEAQNDNHDTQQKSLEEYEAEAKHMLSKKKAKELDFVMKRPASKKAQSKAEPKNKAMVKKHAEKTKHVTPAFLKGIYGCVRCRGNVNGCDSCQSPCFAGLRFSSRQDYNKWYQLKQQSANRK